MVHVSRESVHDFSTSRNDEIAQPSPRDAPQTLTAKSTSPNFLKLLVVDLSGPIRPG